MKGDGEMFIEVTEGRREGNEVIIIKAAVDEDRFILLYGEQDFKILMEKGYVGDTIGQEKWYYAKVREK
jgi:hypothetical protein